MLSLLMVILLAGIGIYGIVLSIDFCEYLRKYNPKQWELITYERPFGIPREEFPINPIKPHKFIVTIFSSEEGYDVNSPAYKIKLKLLLISFVLLFVVLIYIS